MSFITPDNTTLNIIINDGVTPTNFTISGTSDSTSLNMNGQIFYSGTGSARPSLFPMSNGKGGTIYFSDSLQYTSPTGLVGTDTVRFVLSSSSPSPTLTSATGTVTFNVSCLHSSTLILTKEGYTPIYSLIEGDKVITKSNKQSAITKVIKTSIINNKNKTLLKLPPDSIQPGYPKDEILISYGHSVLLEPEKGNLEGKWMMAKNLPKYYPTVHYPEINVSFDLYHIHLENFFEDNLVINNGFIVESLGDGKTIWREEGDFRYKDSSMR